MTNITDDPYKILGISIDASDDDIKKTFRKLALQYHPDKYKENDDMFKKINTAYQILGDSDKRKIYDLSQTFNEKTNIDYKSVLMKFLFNMMKVAVNINEKNKDKDVQSGNIVNNNLNIKLTIVVTLEEIYNKHVKKINIKVKRENTFSIKTIYLSLLNYEESYIYKEQGDEYDGKYGDIIINVKIKHHDYIRIDKYLFRYDLYLDEKISLYELYFGINRVIKYFGDEKITVNRNFLENDDIDKKLTNCFSFVHVEIGKGLPYYDHDKDEECRGDLYICFRLKLPKLKDKNEEVKTFLQSYFNDEESNRIC